MARVTTPTRGFECGGSVVEERAIAVRSRRDNIHGRGAMCIHVARFGLRSNIACTKGSQTCDHGEAEAGLERTREGGSEGASSERRREYSSATDTALAAPPFKR